MDDEELDEAKGWLMEHGYLELAVQDRQKMYCWTDKAHGTYCYIAGEEHEGGDPEARVDCFLLP